MFESTIDNFLQEDGHLAIETHVEVVIQVFKRIHRFLIRLQILEKNRIQTIKYFSHKQLFYIILNCQ